MPETKRVPSEIGVTGLKRHRNVGMLDEEFLYELKDQKGIRVYREMWDNSPVVGAMLRVITLLARRAEIRVDAGGESPEDEKAQFLVESSIEDMSMSWDETLTEILTMLPFGFSYHEILYKMRNGPNRQPGKGSLHTDHLIGWRKLPIRSQDSLHRWNFDKEGGIGAFVQRAPPDYQETVIPIERSLLFRPEAYKQNPEGRSVLRCAYRPYFFGKRIEEIEAIGIERDLAGYPVMRIPGELIKGNDPTFTDAKAAIVNIRRDEQEGMILPSDREEGEYTYDFELLSSGGERSFDTDAVVGRYNKLIAMTVLADFLFIGQQNVGSFSLVSSRTSLFTTAMAGWLDSICSIFNRHAIPRLLAINNIRVDTPPQLAYGDMEKPDPEVWSKAIASLSQAGFNLAGDPEFEQWLRQQFNWPELTDETVEMLEESRTERRDADTSLGRDELMRLLERGNVTDEGDGNEGQ